MGVTDLNKLVSRFPLTIPGENGFDYLYVVIDGSNLITTFLMRYFAKFPRTNRIEYGNYIIQTEKNDLIVEDLNIQIQYIVENIVKDLFDIVHRLKRSTPTLEEVIVVSDPSGKYDYIYKSELKMNNVSSQLFDKWLELKKINVDTEQVSIEFSSKEEEKDIRTKQLNQQIFSNIQIIKKDSQEIIFETDDYDLFKLKYNNEKDNELKDIYQISHHLTYLINKTHIMGLIPLIQFEINEKIKLFNRQKYVNVSYYQSKTEADIFIKALYKRLSFPRMLVLSNDTDYNILFGECENVDTAVISPFNLNNIHNPYKYWSTLFTENKEILSQLLPRISALFGNDYTCHKRKIVCDGKDENIELIRKLFNFDGPLNIHQVKLNMRSLISRAFDESRSYFNKYEPKLMKIHKEINEKYVDDELMKKMKVFDKKYHFFHIDMFVLKDEEYFVKYFETLLIYLNYDKYMEYLDWTLEDMVKPEIVEKIEINGLLIVDLFEKSIIEFKSK